MHSFMGTLHIKNNITADQILEKLNKEKLSCGKLIYVPRTSASYTSGYDGRIPWFVFPPINDKDMIGIQILLPPSGNLVNGLKPDVVPSELMKKVLETNEEYAELARHNIGNENLKELVKTTLKEIKAIGEHLGWK